MNIADMLMKINELDQGENLNAGWVKSADRSLRIFRPTLSSRLMCFGDYCKVHAVRSDAAD